MKVAKDTVVFIDYSLRDDDGELIDSSEGRTPLPYLHGAGNILPGLERALEGKIVGDRVKISLPAGDGYGEWDESLCHTLARDEFESISDLETGMQLELETDGGPIVVTVVEIEDDTVTIDGNHELAGVNLNFDVTVRAVRPATGDEIEHGHVHGADDEDPEDDDFDEEFDDEDDDFDDDDLDEGLEEDLGDEDEDDL
jgi:FKBP-type peptidyl-prolyl cis-trans isomerase SlyD